MRMAPEKNTNPKSLVWDGAANNERFLGKKLGLQADFSLWLGVSPNGVSPRKQRKKMTRLPLFCSRSFVVHDYEMRRSTISPALIRSHWRKLHQAQRAPAPMGEILRPTRFPFRPLLSLIFFSRIQKLTRDLITYF